MADTASEQDWVVRDEAALRSLFPEVSGLAQQKVLPGLDKHARDFIARSPFLCLGTQDGAGRADVSPRGDPAGFVLALDDRTLAIPDRPGNNRLDSLANIVAHPRVGLLFLIPGFEETLRVNGEARLVTDPALLDRMKINDRLPRLAIVVSVTECFLHCAKALRRSRLWSPDALQDRAEMPSLARMILEQTTGAPQDAETMGRIDADLERSYDRSMY